MAITESVGRLAATLGSLLHTRLELAVVELEQESRRFVSFVLLSLLAVFAIGIALLLAAFFVIVLFWDTHRIAAVVGTSVFFTALGLAIGLGARNSYVKKPTLLSHTIAELRKDLDSVQQAGKSR
jgi:uncharacterized membrane protein YqjE